MLKGYARFWSRCLEVLLASTLIVCGPASFSLASDNHGTWDAPDTQVGKRRIAYYEGGPYLEYKRVLVATIRGLMKQGWIRPAAIPKLSGESTEQLWRWMSEELESDHLEFVVDAHYSSNWDENGNRAEVVRDLIERLNAPGEIDMVFAMGTWAGKDLANTLHRTPTLIFAASDPVTAGIIESVEDSGLQHVHAAVDPDIYERQLHVFHSLVGFEKLGIAYEDSTDGRSYAAIEVVEKAAEDLGFEVVHCHTESDIPDLDRAGESVIRCFERLVNEVDAIYVTMQGGVRPESIPTLVQTANNMGIPTFSQAGADEVRYGFLASLAQGDFGYVGEFNATTIGAVLRGAEPNEVSQRFAAAPKIALNLKTAELVGYYLSAEILAAADHLFFTIQAPD